MASQSELGWAPPGLTTKLAKLRGHPAAAHLLLGGRLGKIAGAASSAALAPNSEISLARLLNGRPTYKRLAGGRIARYQHPAGKSLKKQRL